MVDVHPLWRPFGTVTPEELSRARVGERERLPAGRIEVAPPDPAWPQWYDAVARRVCGTLGDRVLELEHVGSTSVPELHAKPVIDVDLTVADSADEPSYLPELEVAGFTLRVREPDWEEHRCLRGEHPVCNLHVWSPGALEPRRHRAFRDWLREHDDDREAYGALKRDLATSGSFDSVMDYNNQKGALVYTIYERIFVADPAHPHTPQPLP
jgi:GrpB-like predicted nucleotidyltransferase (UPF0157 family)